MQLISTMPAVMPTKAFSLSDKLCVMAQKNWGMETNSKLETWSAVMCTSWTINIQINKSKLPQANDTVSKYSATIHHRRFSITYAHGDKGWNGTRVDTLKQTNLLIGSLTKWQKRSVSVWSFSHAIVHDGCHMQWNPSNLARWLLKDSLHL